MQRVEMVVPTSSAQRGGSPSMPILEDWGFLSENDDLMYIRCVHTIIVLCHSNNPLNKVLSFSCCLCTQKGMSKVRG